MPFSITPSFIDIFKIGDNINFNLEVLKVLYEGYRKLPDGQKLTKPIVIINISIVEAILYDFIENRIKRANRTEILFSEILAAFQNKRFDKFEHYITQAQKYNLFDLKDTNLYEAMHILRKKRNRVHIQNSKWEDPRDERDIFDERSKILSERVLEKILDVMVSKYPRRAEYHGYVKDFELPWEKHLVNQTITK